MIRVCHMSSAHRGLDVRIFHKECVSLADAGFDVHLIINAMPEDVALAAQKQVTLHLLPVSQGRLKRFFLQSWRCFFMAKKLDADIYHFHDPELIPYGFVLSIFGKKVIYDVHEDLPKDIFSKDWIPLWMRRIVSGVTSGVEFFGARFCFSIIAATPFIASRFKKVNSAALDVNNYPLLSELSISESMGSKDIKNQVCYVGGISRIRGVLEMVQAMGFVKSGARLQLGGHFPASVFKSQVIEEHGWSQVDELGWLDRDGIRSTLMHSRCGLVTLHPMVNYLDALPVKMFEYMAAGIPVIASNFPLWRKIIEENQCGVCVDPFDPTAIAKSIDYFCANPDEAERMGLNGQRAAAEKYNWAIEEKKLLNFYSKL